MSKKEKIAIVPGSFDPITFGHIYVIKEALKKFDTVYVAVMINKEKNYMFSLDERKRIVEAALSTDSVKVISSEGWLWELAVELNADGIVKGYRNDSDLAYELEMASFNEKHAPNAKTVFVKTDLAFEKISSTLVREKIINNESLEEFVPEGAIKEIIKIQKAKQ